MIKVPDTSAHKLLVANRGEIALRILRTAKRISLHTIAIYTHTDSTSPHVLHADEAVALRPDDEDPASNSRGYLDLEAIVGICVSRGVTLVHPGYGFLSENAHFARLLADKGITLLGPSAGVIEEMGLKHRARELAMKADVPVVPGSEGLVQNLDHAIEFVGKFGFPVMLKATAGGGGMGLVVCRNLLELEARFERTSVRAMSLFHNDGVFLERFYESSRHIEVQIFGDGNGHVIHMCERECSIQRRHQKLLEESPSPYIVTHPDLRKRICDAAVRLGKLVNYKSAGTVEFLVDNSTGAFYFLEMNTRLQVEHGVTEAVFPGLDIVELMIRQGIAEHADCKSSIDISLLQQDAFCQPTPGIHAIEARIYCENPVREFAPSPGVLQYVNIPAEQDLRIDTWVETGTTVSPYFDPLIAKAITQGKTREEAAKRLARLLSMDGNVDKRIVIQGPPNNIPFLHQVLNEPSFIRGEVTTGWVDSGGVTYAPRAFSVISPGLSTTVQALPERKVGLGIPKSGPMDVVAFKVANILAGNSTEGDEGCDALEVVVPVVAPTSGAKLGGPIVMELLFHNEVVVALAGALAEVTIDGKSCDVWSAVRLKRGSRLCVAGVVQNDNKEVTKGGLRVYVAVNGGFSNIPVYLGSKATSIGVGGYQGRTLAAGDLLFVGSAKTPPAILSLPRTLIPEYRADWSIYVLSGPHDDPEFITPAGIESFYSRTWRVSPASNRMGIRLERVKGTDSDGEEVVDEPVIDWARENGGEGGSHPSNILDSGYAPGSINLNGDTPVILTKEGPSMGGYLCVSTVCTGDMWKLGQARPGDTIRFRRVSWDDAVRLMKHTNEWIESILALVSGYNAKTSALTEFNPSSSVDGFNNDVLGPTLFETTRQGDQPRVVFRQAGDSAILVEYGEMQLDIALRARVHALETCIRERGVPVKELAPCIRSTMVHYDAHIIPQKTLLEELININASLPSSVAYMSFPGRKITFPIVLDDKWCQEAINRYMKSARDKAVYLPSNVEYLARNNGLKTAQEALELLVRSSWLVFGVGFYLACPFLVPIDPRCRVVGQKMNPSRTYTPRGAIGIAGVVAAIYPVESPGGYQLYGRTLPAWQTWGSGEDFAPGKPWLLEPFDQVDFEVVSEADYIEIEKNFDAGKYKFKISPVVFSMKDYLEFESSIRSDIDKFQAGQADAVVREEAREQELLKEWQQSMKDNAQTQTEDTGDVGLDAAAGAAVVTAPVTGTVWKINVEAGDVVRSADEVLVILEAMKTEVNVTAGAENIGTTVVGLGRGIRHGSAVQAGQALVILK